LSQNDERTIDLFGWGTGDNPKKHTTKEADYTTFTEWGNNPIFNGGNTANQWRTLKSDEWDYLFLRRDRANELFGFGKVHGVKGLIILPDGWQKRKGMPDFTAVKDTEMKSASYGGYKDDMDSNHYADNDLSDDEWNALKESGAVFLPAGGWREGSGIAEVGAYGRYWSADPYSVQGKAADIYFEKYRMGTQGGADFYYGASVRLVQDVK
jgi:hypothetical protein